MLAIIDYGMGNLGSIKNMLKRIGYNDVVITSSVQEIEQADKLILPGVGAFDTGMRHLHESGLLPILNEKVLNRKTPVLGVCLGMQLLMKNSEEGTHLGLGWIDGSVVKFAFEEDESLKVPHMGWNTLDIKREDILLTALEEEARFYFVHSYHVNVDANPAWAVATTHHGVSFASMVHQGNIFGTQFHPEKSHRFGMQIYRNFVELV